MDLTTILTAVSALIIGVVVGYFILKASLKKQSQKTISDAKKEAENIKTDKILQAKEKFIELKAEHEKVINRREHKMNEQTNRAKDRDKKLNQQAEENNRKYKEAKRLEEALTRKTEANQRKAEDLERMHKSQVEQLEVISGLTGEEAKAQLQEALKEEARNILTKRLSFTRTRCVRTRTE